jgi:hypothetical protein
MEILLFLKFGLILNVFIGIIDLGLNLISAKKLGLFEIAKLAPMALKELEEYKAIKRKYEPIRLFLELSSMFIPFYYSWLVIKRMLSSRKGISYFELPIILKMEEINELKKKYNC